MKKVLHVGCGQKTIESMGSGFHDGSWQEVRFDVDERVRPDVVGSIVKMEAVPDGSMDAIWSSHNLEHVFHHEAPHVLREFRRVLKDSGFCVITCPDIENVCARVAAGSLTEELYRTPAGPMTALDVLYGHLASVARGEVHMAHKTGFDLRLLAARLQQAGFPRYFGRRRRWFIDLWFIAFNRRISRSAARENFQRYTDIPPDGPEQPAPAVEPTRPG